jgi:DNA helicase IV
VHDPTDPTPDQTGPPDDERAREQEHLDRLYGRLDELRAEARAQRDAVLRTRGAGAVLVERDARAADLGDRLARLDSAENGLCFGRLDTRDGQVRYVGRLGLRSRPPEREPLVLDWRAPGARPFYLATPGRPLGVARRRHLRTRGRTVVDLNDDLLDLDARHGLQLQGEGALLAALTAERTGRMHDVVATLQREQDEIVRADADGVLVVQGGPGTGKTAVALHRAAYLLYSSPAVTRRGVLVVGPTPAFLDYIGQVLPSLGETQVVLATAATLYPGVVPDRSDSAEEERVKGDLGMVDVLARAVRDRQGADDDVAVTFEGDTYVLTARVLRAAADEARRSGLPHNLARQVFRREVLAELSWLVVDRGRQLLEDVEEGFAEELARLDAELERHPDEAPARLAHQGSDVDGLLGAHEREHLERELLADPGVAAVLERLWPLLTPERLLTELFAEPRRLARAGVPAAARMVLHRARGGWSAADVPLLDEAAKLLGVDTTAVAARDERRRREHLRFARQVLAQADLLGAVGDDVLAADGTVSAEALAARHTEDDHRTMAERAAADRTWAYGHVVVDEAQELSPMVWRALFRRCPSRSMTVVGDLDQASSACGASSWGEMLRPHAGSAWRRVALTVNYRTPAEVMDAALPVLRALDPQAGPPLAVRAGGSAPWRLRVDGDLVGAVVAAVGRERGAGGHLAVIAPEELVAPIGTALTAAHPGTSFGPAPDLERAVVVLTPDVAKGLEFDGVLVVDPGRILARPRGLGALYVALTRATRRLGILHRGEAPEVLRHVPAR